MCGSMAGFCFEGEMDAVVWQNICKAGIPHNYKDFRSLCACAVDHLLEQDNSLAAAASAHQIHEMN